MPKVSFNVNPDYAHITELVPGLLISGVTALNRQTIDEYGITLVVNATSEVPNLRSLGDVMRIKLWLEDTPQTYIYPHFEVLLDQIHEEICSGGRVLVHCVAGVSRSASICLAYLTRFVCHSLREAYHLMAAKRPLVRPNIGFWKQLIAFEENLKSSKSSVRLIYDEVQEEHLLPDVYVHHHIPSSNDDEMFTNDLMKQQRSRRFSGERPKFHPLLEPLVEVVESAA
ncbi:hypothetical protein AB6A40_004228 [Gnathostoma spinigerum]|uniref:Dual specificity protein phosphatase 14 n=1 Tax=Gnathostoma spinigerum TaxID=75299 RepID=A0ABD6EBV4_9BILA